MLKHEVSKMFLQLNKRQRIPTGQSNIDDPEKLASQGTQDEEKHRETGIIGYTR